MTTRRPGALASTLAGLVTSEGEFICVIVTGRGGGHSTGQEIGVMACDPVIMVARVGEFIFQSVTLLVGNQ